MNPNTLPAVDFNVSGTCVAPLPSAFAPVCEDGFNVDTLEFEDPRCTEGGPCAVQGLLFAPSLWA